MQNDQKSLTSAAVRYAHDNFGIELDYTHESIKHIEQMLNSLARTYLPRDYLDEIDYYLIALQFAAYIVSVIEHNGMTGHWASADSPHGQYGYHLADGSQIFPYSWCVKRLKSGNGDQHGENIWTKYQHILLKQ